MTTHSGLLMANSGALEVVAGGSANDLDADMDGASLEAQNRCSALAGSCPSLHPVQPDLHSAQRRLLRRKPLLAPSRVGPSVHPAGSCGEGLGQVARCAEPMPDPLSLKGEPIAPTETLRLISKVVALPTPEVPVSSVE